jgi:Fuc2NAc and GlcNAc transferase
MRSSLLPILSLSSFLISLLTVSLIKQRFSQQLLDIPNDRSSHTQPTPRGGGVGFVIAFALTSTIASFLLPSSLPLFPLWLILLPLVIIGLIDDRQGVPSSIRYLVQLSSAGIATAYLGAFPQPWLLGFGMFGSIVAIALTLIGMTAIINFYNFMDGLDGLVAGCTAVQLGFLALYLHQPILWLLVAALLGFLVWNWSPAKIFMGDVGSTTLGATVAFALLNSDKNTSQTWSALAIALPLLGDAIYTLFRRLLRRENIFKAHRSHLYQRLQQFGWSHPRVALIYIGLTLLIGCSLSVLGVWGAWLSLVGILGTIILGEIYLTFKGRDLG